MNTPNDGGPAFPVHANHFIFNDKVVSAHYPGMSLRDYFAGQALSAVIGNLNTEQGISVIRQFSMEDGISPDLVIAKMSYEYADAMLAARDGKEGN